MVPVPPNGKVPQETATVGPCQYALSDRGVRTTMPASAATPAAIARRRPAERFVEHMRQERDAAGGAEGGGSRATESGSGPAASLRRAGRPMTAPADCVPAPGAEVPTTLLLGHGWPAAGRAAHRLARRLAARLGHDVEACDLDGPGEPLSLLVRQVVARGATRLVLLPLALGEPTRPDPRRADAVAAAQAAWPFLRIHRGRPPAIDDVARMLGDRARDAAADL